MKVALIGIVALAIFFGLIIFSIQLSVAPVYLNVSNTSAEYVSNGTFGLLVGGGNYTFNNTVYADRFVGNIDCSNVTGEVGDICNITSSGGNGTAGSDGVNGTGFYINYTTVTRGYNYSGYVINSTGGYELNWSTAIYNGSDGSNGATGPAGSDGTNGTNGSDGTNGTVTTFDQDLNTTNNVTFVNITAENVFANINWSYILNAPAGLGTDGTNGTNGINGTGFYINYTEIANGYNITGFNINTSGGYEFNWSLELYNGSTGSAGSDGTNGTIGSDGTNGTNGTNGSDGINGTNGSDGSNGTFLGILNSTQFYNISNNWSINGSWINSIETDPIYSANTYATGMDQDVSSTGTPQFEYATFWGLGGGGLAIIRSGGQIDIIPNTTYLQNESDPIYVAENSTIARIGDCPLGQVVQNTTTGGVECVPLVTASTTYYPNTTQTTGGTNTTGNITLMWYYDNSPYNVSEGTGANPMDLYINYTNVTDFSQWVIREYYAGSPNHFIQFQLWDYDDAIWENYFQIVGQTNMTIITIPVFDPSKHINNTIVQTRLHHVETGIAVHRLYVDFAWLIQGNNIGASTNLDGYARYSFQYNNFSGRGNFNTSGNVTATNISATQFFGNLNWSWIQNAPAIQVFDQSLNTTDSVSFGNVTATNFLGNLNWSYIQNAPTITTFDQSLNTGDSPTFVNLTLQNLTVTNYATFNNITAQNASFYNVSVQNITIQDSIYFPSNNRIWDNSTCVAIVGATSTLWVC